jgi:hypothetical protein
MIGVKCTKYLAVNEVRHTPHNFNLNHTVNKTVWWYTSDSLLEKPENARHKQTTQDIPSRLIIDTIPIPAKEEDEQMILKK